MLADSSSADTTPCIRCRCIWWTLGLCALFLILQPVEWPLLALLWPFLRPVLPRPRVHAARLCTGKLLRVAMKPTEVHGR